MGLTDTHSSPAHSAVLPSQPDTHSGTFTQRKDVTVTALAPAYICEEMLNLKMLTCWKKQCLHIYLK